MKRRPAFHGGFIFWRMERTCGQPMESSRSINQGPELYNFNVNGKITIERDGTTDGMLQLYNFAATRPCQAPTENVQPERNRCDQQLPRKKAEHRGSSKRHHFHLQRWHKEAKALLPPTRQTTAVKPAKMLQDKSLSFAFNLDPKVHLHPVSGGTWCESIPEKMAELFCQFDSTEASALILLFKSKSNGAQANSSSTWADEIFCAYPSRNEFSASIECHCAACNVPS